MLGMVTLPGALPKGNETGKEVDLSNFTSLLEDFNDLPEIKDGIDLKERDAKEKILFLLLRSDDPEVEKAFGIMQEYGHASNFTNYEFSAHNTQLEVLLWLAEEREIRNYERIALAIALYDAVLAIGDEEVRKEPRDYAFMTVETDQLTHEISRHSEADIALV